MISPRDRTIAARELIHGTGINRARKLLKIGEMRFLIHGK
jgi:hypothetical protein